MPRLQPPACFSSTIVGVSLIGLSEEILLDRKDLLGEWAQFGLGLREIILLFWIGFPGTWVLIGLGLIVLREKIVLDCMNSMRNQFID